MNDMDYHDKEKETYRNNKLINNRPYLFEVLQEWFNGEKKSWKREAIFSLQLCGNQLICVTNDDLSLRTIKDFIKEYEKNESEFLDQLTSVWEDEPPYGAIHRLDLLIYIFLEWQDGKKYFSDINLKISKKTFDFYIKHIHKNIMSEIGSYDKEEVFNDIKNRLEKNLNSCIVGKNPLQ